MKNIRRIAAVGLLFCMLLSGCQFGDKSIVILKPLSSRHVFQLGDATCSVKEAKVYLANYQNLYGEAYTLNLWEHDFGDNSLEEYIKDVTLNKLVTVACMSQLAEEKGVLLTQEDETNIEKTAKAYHESLSKEDKEYLDVSVSELTEYYSRYALAQRFYDSLIHEIDGEVSDDEARVMEVQQIFTTDAQTAEVVRTKLSEGEDFASVANAYNELPSNQAYLCREDLSKEAEEVIFKLDEKETSDIIKVENGYYFVKCIDKYNEKLTEENKVVILEKREKEALDSIYNEFITGLASYINEDVWEGLKVDRTSGVTTNRFFEIYEMYCKSEWVSE